MLGFVNVVFLLCMTCLIAKYSTELWKNLIWLPSYILSIVSLYYFENVFLTIISILSFIVTLIIYNKIVDKKKRKDNNGNT